MTDRPILVQGPMIRALLAGTKSQTRRVVKPQPQRVCPVTHLPRRLTQDRWRFETQPCPYGVPGDRLWVKETIQLVPDQEPDDGTGRVLSIYAADGALTVADAWPWKRKQLNSIHCPRGLSRITLEVTGVRVERLQDISRGDAMAEGCPFPNMAKGDDPRKWYADLWDQINAPCSWDANPWVWVVELKRVTP